MWKIERLLIESFIKIKYVKKRDNLYVIQKKML